MKPAAGNVGSASFTIEVKRLVIDIDIKLGSDPNSLNLNGNGVVPVVVLGSLDFDASETDVSGVSFGVDGTEAVPVHNGHIEDVNGDGIPDMVLHFREGDPGIDATTPGETILTLTLMGWLNDGLAFIGFDEVRITPNDGSSRGKGGKGPK